MKTHLYLSDNFMEDRILIVNQGNKFLVTENYILVAQVKDVQK